MEDFKPAPRAFVLDQKARPLMPCTKIRAYELIHKGRAKIIKRYPFTIILEGKLLEDSVL